AKRHDYVPEDPSEKILGRGTGGVGHATPRDKDADVVRRIGLILGAVVVLVVALFSVWIISRPERGTTGSVSTTFRFLGPNDKIVVDGFDDPKVEGVACHISRAQTGE